MLGRRKIRVAGNTSVKPFNVGGIWLLGGLGGGVCSITRASPSSRTRIDVKSKKCRFASRAGAVIGPPAPCVMFILTVFVSNSERAVVTVLSEFGLASQNIAVPEKVPKRLLSNLSQFLL